MADTNQMLLKSINLLREENALYARESADRENKQTSTSLLMYKTMKSVLEEIRQDRLQNEEDRREKKTEEGKVAGAGPKIESRSTDVGGGIAFALGALGAIPGLLLGSIEGVGRGIKAIFQTFKIGLVALGKSIALGFKAIKFPVKVLFDATKSLTGSLLNLLTGVFKSLRMSLGIRLAQILDFLDDSTANLRKRIRSRAVNIFNPIRDTLNLFSENIKTDMREIRKAFGQSFIGRFTKNSIAAIRTIVGLPGAFLNTLSVGIKSADFETTGKETRKAFQTLLSPLNKLKGLFGKESKDLAKTVDAIEPEGKKLTSRFQTAKNIFTRFGSFIDDLVVRLYVFYDDTTKPLQRTVSRFAEDGKRLGSVFKSTFGFVGNTFDSVKKFFTGIMDTVKTFSGSFQRFFALFRTLGRFVFFPITIITGIIDAFKGFTRGMEETSGSMLGGVFGAIGEIFASIIGMPLDLLKGLVGWIAGKFGLEGVQETLSEFSFADMIRNLFDSVTDSVLGFIDAMKDESGNFDFGKITKVIFGGIFNAVISPLNALLELIAKGVEKLPIPGTEKLAESIRGIKIATVDTGIGEAVAERKETRAENQERIQKEEKAKAEAAKAETPDLTRREVSNAALTGAQRENREATSQAAINAIQIAPVTNSTNVSNTNTAAVMSSNMPTVDNLDRSWAPA